MRLVVLGGAAVVALLYARERWPGVLEGSVVGPAESVGYSRDAWPHWADDDRDCQDARQEVLIAESEIPVTFEGPRKCKVGAGRWTCPYTGKVFTDPRKLDVDHMVPLHNAHLSGGDRWDEDRRRAYANELGAADHLVAVAAGANRQKGDKGPEAWLPDNGAFRCDYVRRWVGVKSAWKLEMSTDERVAVRAALDVCERGGVPDRPVRKRSR